MSKSSETAHIDIDYVADLARLDLSAEEKARFRKELEDVLEYMGQLEELDLDGIRPTAHAAPMSNVMRADETGQGLARDEVLARAPDTAADSSVRVPKVIEDLY